MLRSFLWHYAQNIISEDDICSKHLGITLACCAADAFATETVNLYHAPLSNLKHLPLSVPLAN